MADIPVPDDFLEMLKNKDKVLSMLLKDLNVCRQNEVAFTKLLDSLDGNADPAKVAKAFAKSNKHLNAMNARLSMILIAYCAGSGFDSDVAKTLLKMGRGQDALKEMFKGKNG